MEENKIKISLLQNNIFQIIKTTNVWYHIYIDGEFKRNSSFAFCVELEFEDLLNAKSIVFKEI